MRGEGLAKEIIEKERWGENEIEKIYGKFNNVSSFTSVKDKPNYRVTEFIQKLELYTT